MKDLPLLFLFLLGMAACQPASQSAEEVTAGDPTLTGCYAYRQDSNQVLAHLQMDNDSITGALRYDFYEKDDNTGTLAGIARGDTLVGVYTFYSEGQASRREVAFLVRGDSLAEGYGPMQEENGVQRFEDREQLTFGQGITMAKTACREDSAGCLLDFGERWSYIRNACIQPRQEGVMLSVTSRAGGAPAYLLFSEDHQQAEVFLPRREEVLSMERSERAGDDSWVQDAYSLTPERGYLLQRDGQPLYAAE